MVFVSKCYNTAFLVTSFSFRRTVDTQGTKHHLTKPDLQDRTMRTVPK